MTYYTRVLKNGSEVGRYQGTGAKKTGHGGAAKKAAKDGRGRHTITMRKLDGKRNNPTYYEHIVQVGSKPPGRYGLKKTLMTY